jgi:hypothetical protein
MEGGCACGSVRYRLDAEPYDSGWCHCRLCQRVSGSGGMVFATVARDKFIVMQGLGKVGTFQSTSFGERSFCRDCGSPLTIHVRHQPDEIDVTVGTLDDPAKVAPTFHLYVSEMPEWMIIGDDLPRFDALRPTTRGLPPGQTEG